MVHNGRLSSVEEAKLDIDGLAVQLSSALFQLVVQVYKRIFRFGTSL